jgi:hypothetical protein
MYFPPPGRPSWNPKFYWTRFSIRKALKRGSAESLKELLKVFPDACRNCGNREFDRVSTALRVEVEDPGEYYSAVTHSEVMTCCRCQLSRTRILASGLMSGVSVGNVSTSRFRAYSPFMDYEDADRFTDYQA